MPWRDMSIMDSKMEFINEYRSGAWTMAELCRQFGISRPLGYKYLRRFEKQGFSGLEEASRAPKAHPNQTPARQEAMILELRREHPNWGAEKLLVILKEQKPELSWPSISTGNEILKRNGMVVP